jgi:hypothetical protein
MKIQLIVLLTTLTLAAGCTSQSHYRAAEGKHDSGYQEKSLTEDQWLISYRSRARDAEHNYQRALRRAAERTMLQGYDWFEVVNREQFSRERERLSAQYEHDITPPRREVNCGLLTCRERVYAPQTVTRVSYDTNTSQGPATTRIEIRMGKGLRPEEGRFYNARDVIEEAEGRASKPTSESVSIRKTELVAI